MTQEPPPRIRVARVVFPERYELPPRPAGAPLAMLDAYRQTQFLLGNHLSLFARTMNLQLRIVAASAKARSYQAAALLGLWSRTFSYLADAGTLLVRGSYVSCFPLVRSACDAIAAQKSLIADGFQEYLHWLTGAVRQDRQHTALAIDLGRFRAGSVLAEDERLGAIYRPASELAMPHFGSTTLQTGPETSLQRLALAFADNAFHLGWAEVIAGWLLVLADVQLETAVDSGAFVIAHEVSKEQQRLSLDIQGAIANPRRCYVEEVESRFLFHNFRRASGGAPKRVLL